MGILNISQFPEFTGDSQGSIAVLNDSQNTQTYKIVRETLFSSSLNGTSSWANNSITASTTYLIGINGLSNSGSALELGGTLYKNTIISGTKDGTYDYTYPTSSFPQSNGFTLDHTGQYIYFATYSGSANIDGGAPSGVIKVSLNTNEIDNTFNSGGIGISGSITSFGGAIRSITVDPSTGKLYIIGNFATYNTTSSRGIARLNIDGTRDDSFNPGVGFSGYNQGNYPYTVPYGLFIDDNGKLLVFGSFSNYSGSTCYGTVRLNSNGTVDTSYTSPNFSGVVNTAKKAPDNKIYCVGTFTNIKNRIVRLNNDGSVDSSFNVGTGASNYITNNFPGTFDLDSQNRLVVVGNFTSYSGSATNRIVRINTDGTRDLTFNVGGSGLTAGTAFGQFYGAVRIDQYDRIYITGTYTVYNGVTINKIARLLPNGQLDRDFYTGTGFTVSPSNVELISNPSMWYNNYLYVPLTYATNGTINSLFSYNGTPGGRSWKINTSENNLILSSNLVKYDEDNLASFTSRSLIDKDYADNRVARLATGSVTASMSNTSFTINTGSLFTGSLSVSESVNITRFFSLLTVSSSFDFVDDTAAGNAGIPLAGIYRSGSVLRIRLQ